MKSPARSKTSGKPKLVLHTLPEKTAEGRQTTARYWFIADDRRIFPTGFRADDWKGPAKLLRPTNELPGRRQQGDEATREGTLRPSNDPRAHSANKEFRGDKVTEIVIGRIDETKSVGGLTCGQVGGSPPNRW